MGHRSSLGDPAVLLAVEVAGQLRGLPRRRRRVRRLANRELCCALRRWGVGNETGILERYGFAMTSVVGASRSIELSVFRAGLETPPTDGFVGNFYAAL